MPGRRFELLKAMPADLQSAPFGRSGNLACTLECGYVLYYEVPPNMQIAWQEHLLAHALDRVVRQLAQGFAGSAFGQQGKLVLDHAQVRVDVGKRLVPAA